MTTEENVIAFLQHFQTKLKVYGIIYRDDRGKNQRTLEELEIIPSSRKLYLERLEVQDYISGPIQDLLHQKGDMWVFGKDIKGYPIYIKIMLGPPNSYTICISFHIAEHPLHYPFKTQQS